MEETGKILKVKGKQALVKIKRHSLCSKCTNKCQLAAPESHEIDEIEIEVDNPINAEKGQYVKIEMKDQPVVIASIVVYIIPLVFMIIGYFFGVYFIEFIGYQGTEIVGIISSLIFLAYSFLLIRFIDKILSRNKKYHPKIKEVVKNSN